MFFALYMHYACTYKVVDAWYIIPTRVIRRIPNGIFAIPKNEWNYEKLYNLHVRINNSVIMKANWPAIYKRTIT